MKVTLGTLVNAQSVIRELSGLEVSDVRLAYRLARLSRAMQPELEEFDKARRKLLERYGERISSAETETWKLRAGDEEKFVEEMNKLLAEEVVLNVIPLSLDEYGALVGKASKPAWLASLLGWFVEEANETQGS